MGIYFFDQNDKNHNLIKKTHYLNADEIKTLSDILDTLGFSISSFPMLISYLKEITMENRSSNLKSSDVVPYIIQQKNQIELRKKNFSSFKQCRKKSTDIQNKLIIFDKIAKILDFGRSKYSCFEKLFNHRKFFEKEKIFEKCFFMKKLNDKLENFSENNLLEIKLENSESLSIHSLVDEPHNDIIYDFELENLYEIEKHNKRLITTKKLKATTDEVR